MSKQDGGPAFPVVPTSVRSGEWGYAYTGMTLRDWFAGQALVGVLIAGGWGDYESAAMHAREQADAMIAEMAKE